MKWLITGLGGTLAPVLARVARGRGVEVIGWDRRAVPPDDALAANARLVQVRPDAIAHLGMGSSAWAALLAAHAASGGLPFIFTSTAMVFHRVPDGPHAAGDERNTQDPYGEYKRECEDRVLAAHPGATVARLGRQIVPRQQGNNMLMALDEWQSSKGVIAASRLWRPACSFMEDTAVALADLLLDPGLRVLHLDSNAGEGHSFDAIARALQRSFGRAHWRISPDDDYKHDQRLAGGCARVPTLSERLPALVDRFP